MSYWINTDMVEVIRVLHGAQNIPFALTAT